MLDIGWSELFVIGVVALLVVGPKDLPKMFRTVGQYMNRARSMAREFQRNMEDAAREAGMEDVNRQVRDVANLARHPASTLAQFGADHTAAYVKAMERPVVTPAPPAAGTTAAAATTPAVAAPAAPAATPAATGPAPVPPGPASSA